MTPFRLLSDENLHDALVTGLPSLDMVRARDVALAARPAPEILACADGEGRIVLSHDVATMPAFAKARLARGEPMPGLFLITQGSGLSRILDELEYVFTEGDPAEWEGTIAYFRG